MVGLGFSVQGLGFGVEGFVFSEGSGLSCGFGVSLLRHFFDPRDLTFKLFGFLWFSRNRKV